MIFNFLCEIDWLWLLLINSPVVRCTTWLLLQGGPFVHSNMMWLLCGVTFMNALLANFALELFRISHIQLNFIALVLFQLFIQVLLVIVNFKVTICYNIFIRPKLRLDCFFCFIIFFSWNVQSGSVSCLRIKYHSRAKTSVTDGVTAFWIQNCYIPNLKTEINSIYLEFCVNFCVNSWRTLQTLNLHRSKYLQLWYFWLTTTSLFLVDVW